MPRTLTGHWTFPRPGEGPRGHSQAAAFLDGKEPGETGAWGFPLPRILPCRAAGLTELLTGRGHQVVAAVDNAEDLLASLATDAPDVVILDNRMPPTHTNEGIRAALALRTTDPSVGVLGALPIRGDALRIPVFCRTALGDRIPAQGPGGGWARSSRRWHGLPPGKPCSTRRSSASS
ncbi:response regulator [Arthrobacter sp. AQ5-05]|uniref:response regulator n=1 Tax=Arthrobacter sp. AQ5-05 TaxID=2184581 RepID=UPI00336A0586